MSSANSTPILLKTKLHKPQLQLDLVVRTHLLQKLHHGLGLPPEPATARLPVRRLTLVAAPAGFGKSTLVVSWLATLEAEAAAGQHAWGKNCWLSLDTHDNNLARFSTYVVAAVRSVYPDACANFGRLLQVLPLPNVATLSETLLMDFGELPGNLVIVLDDYQQVQSLDVQQLVESLILQAPLNLHLVLASRLDPPLPLSRLRVQKQITEVRAAELRFSVAEAGLFFERALGLPLAGDTVQVLDERAEGWIAGLRLAAMSLQEGTDPAVLASAFRGTQHHILDFLLEQVMAQQPPCVVEFLACTAPLEMLCAPLCGEVLAAFPMPADSGGSRFVMPGRTNADPLRIDSRAVLEYLDRSHLFIVPLDNTRQWYRYHHLFRDMLLYWLQTRHTPDEVAAIHRQAAAWYARNGHIDVAVRQLLTAGAEQEAADLIETSIPAMLGRASWPTLQQLLASVPDEVLAQRPILILAKAWLMWVLQRHDLLPNMLHQAEVLLNNAELEYGQPRPSWLQGWIDALWSLVYVLQWDFEAALARSEDALAKMPPAHGYSRGVTIVYYLVTLQFLGRRDEALVYYAHARANELDDSAQRVAIAPGILSIYYADLAGLAATGENCLRTAPPLSVAKLHGWGHLCLGIAAYEQNNLAVAEQHFAAVYENRFGRATMLVFDALYGLALTHHALGDTAGATSWAAALLNLAGDLQSAYLIAVAHWLQCQLELQRGVIPTPLSSHQWCIGTAPSLYYRWGELPELTYARLLVAQASRASLAEAVDLLRPLVERCERYHLRWRQIEATAILAMAYQGQGKESLAHETLMVAIGLAQPLGFVRTFVDLGPQMANLLYALARKGFAADYVGRLLTAFPLNSRNAVAVAAADKLDDEIIEPLSEREIEVLALLAERLSDKEIAERLRISPLTVRRHSVNLYQKLHVNSRRQAVIRAQALGLLSPTA
jgi:LuxR family transcriptional regulator, maltose regulon positive regulatory protein